MDNLEKSRERWFSISAGIFGHRRKLREANWLFLYYVHRTTDEITDSSGCRLGRVFYGRACPDSDAASALGCSTRTIAKWRNTLASFGYIAQKSTGRGQVITVNRSKKWPWKNETVETQTYTNVPVRPEELRRSDRKSCVGQESFSSSQVAQNQRVADDVKLPKRIKNSVKETSSKITCTPQQGGGSLPEKLSPEREASLRACWIEAKREDDHSLLLKYRDKYPEQVARFELEWESGLSCASN
jgi:hypothetical protein